MRLRVCCPACGGVRAELVTKADAALYCCADCGQVAEPPRNSDGAIVVTAAESVTAIGLETMIGSDLDELALSPTPQLSLFASPGSGSTGGNSNQTPEST